MTRLSSQRALVGGAALTSFVVLAVACSSGGDEQPPADGGAPDTSTVLAEDGALPGAFDGSDADATPPKTCSDDDVCHTELPPNSLLRGIWSAGDGIVWAVSWSDPTLILSPGHILRWDGSAWSQVYRDGARINAIWGSSATDIWVGGDSGLFHGTGTSPLTIAWTKVRSEPIQSIWGTSANDVWAVGSTVSWRYDFDGKVLHYSGPKTDGSDGWEIDPISSRPLAIVKVWGTSADDVWLGGAESNGCEFCNNGMRAVVLRRRSQAGERLAFVADGLPEFGAVSHGSFFSTGGSTSRDDVWLFGNLALKYDPSYDVLFKGVKKTDGSGDYTWSDSSFGTCRGNAPCDGVWFTRALWSTSPNDVYLAGDGGQLRHWDGTKFTFVKTTVARIPLFKNLYAMWGTSATDLWIVGDDVALHKVAPNSARKP